MKSRSSFRIMAMLVATEALIAAAWVGIEPALASAGTCPEKIRVLARKAPSEAQPQWLLLHYTDGVCRQVQRVESTASEFEIEVFATPETRVWAVAPGLRSGIVSAANGPLPLIFVFEKSPRIQGALFSQETGEAIHGATVVAAEIGDTVFGSRFQTTTGSDGRFVLDLIPPGETEIMVRAPGFVDRIVAFTPTEMHLKLSSKSDRASSEIGGVGAIVNEKAVVIDVLQNSPAHGILAKGDVIVSVDDTLVAGKQHREILRMIRGAIDSEVKLVYKRDGIIRTDFIKRVLIRVE